MLATLPVAFLLACSPVVSLPGLSACADPTPVVHADDSLVVAEGVSPAVAEAVRAFVEAVSSGDVERVRDELDMDEFMARVERSAGESIGRIEARVVRSTMVDPILESTLMPYAEMMLRDQLELRNQTTQGGNLGAVLRLREAPDAGDT